MTINKLTTNQAKVTRMVLARAFQRVGALAVWTALVFGGSAQAATLTWQISVDTSSLSGTSGYLDFQFSAGNTPFDAGIATLSNFSTDGLLTGALADIGPVSGSLPGTVTISNSAPNDHTEGFTFGSFFDVFLTLDLPAISGDAAAGSTFSFAVLDSDFGPLLLGSSPQGQNLIQIDLDAETGLPLVANYSGGQAHISESPEPAAMQLVLLGLAGLAFSCPRRSPRC